MKKIALAALAVAMFAAPLAVATPADAHERGRGHDRHDRYDRDDDDWDDRRDERQSYRRGYRDGRHHDRWDDRQFNGYWHGDRWYYGPPARYSDAYRYDYRGWRRGDRLPAYYRDHYRPVDWRHYRLREPPRGYHYVYNDNRDEYLLVGIATGVILGVILAQ
jgi:Ni/Co efflux regulator RcnB